MGLRTVSGYCCGDGCCSWRGARLRLCWSGPGTRRSGTPSSRGVRWMFLARPRSSTGCRAVGWPGSRSVHRDLAGAGGAEPAVAPHSKATVRRTGGRRRRWTASRRSARPPRCIMTGSGNATHAVTLEQWQEVFLQIAARVAQVARGDVSSVALDIYVFATLYRDRQRKGACRAAWKGQAEAERLAGWSGSGLAATRDGGPPLTWHADPGDKPDVTQFPGMHRRAQDRVRTGPRRCCGTPPLLARRR